MDKRSFLQSLLGTPFALAFPWISPATEPKFYDKPVLEKDYIEFTVHKTAVTAKTRYMNASYTMEMYDPYTDFRKFWRASRKEIERILGNETSNTQGTLEELSKYGEFLY